ncbi:LANO_0E15258g1_1 [Lachancea nothofagi CBS 11611]|uniref:LANO_0E15258g1_1 n=1 Tax=Lachancea nothofagi CBS 11611 TaxID=1266666 RepID=A0A1G4K0V4_9SACH|nr:LANO_0E15258g1_1 [Lachancea nothofagi CBS 11611]
MSGRLVLKELKAGLNASGKFPVTDQTLPISRYARRIGSPNEAATIGSLSKENGFCKPNKRLLRYGNAQNTLLEARSGLRGTSSTAQVYQNTFRVFSAQSKVYQCDFFRLLYFPPDHFLSVFRKSKPASNVRIVGEVFLNGNVSRSEGRSVTNTAVFEKGSRIDKYGKSQDMSNLKRLQSIFANDGSNVPRNYAYLRRSLRTFLNKCFVKNWLELQGHQAVEEQISHSTQSTETNSSTQWKFLDSQGRSKSGVSKDGFYLFQVLVFPDPTTKHEFEMNISHAVKAVADLHWDSFLRGKTKSRTWVQDANDRVRVSTMNGYLAHDQVPRTLRKVK